ncbi:MAG: hypothetical protein GVY35_00990 [Bacteroidetes bacterium]|nr:hypothetical protein [Bacteroidota bacterium]
MSTAGELNRYTDNRLTRLDMEIPDLDKAKLEALEEFVISCTVPFAGRKGKNRGVIGTGTLFSAAGSYFIITADHVANFIREGKEMTIPSSRDGGLSLTLGHGTVYGINDDETDLDLAIVQLEDDELIQTLRDGWNFVGPNNVSSVDEDSEFFYVAGYPNTFASQHNADLNTGLVTIIASRYNGEVSNFEIEINEEVHLLLNHHKTGRFVDGTEVPSPKLHVISGASVWSLRYESGSSDLWVPSKALKIVAVQNSYSPGTYIRATKWLAVARVLKEADDEAFVEAGKVLLGESV